MTTAYAAAERHSEASDLVARIREGFDRWRLYRRTVAELGALSNRALADLGYSRGEVRAIARREVYGL